MARHNVHLGKKAYVIPLGDQEAIIFGADDFDQEAGTCALSMSYKIQPVGAEFDIDNPGEDCRDLYAYESKSELFTSGRHNEGDVRRYLKSRFRDFFRMFNRVHDAAERVQLLVRQADEHEQEMRRNSRNRRSAVAAA